LRQLATSGANPFDDVALEYINPHTSGPLLPTMTCWIQLIRARVRTRAHRQINSAVYHVFRERDIALSTASNSNGKPAIFSSSHHGSGTSTQTTVMRRPCCFRCKTPPSSRPLGSIASSHTMKTAAIRLLAEKFWPDLCDMPLSRLPSGQPSSPLLNDPSDAVNLSRGFDIV
jgi:hypothetical protein